MSDGNCGVSDGLTGVSHVAALGVGKPLGVSDLAQCVALELWL
jgi:hypothetical protein